MKQFLSILCVLSFTLPTSAQSISCKIGSVQEIEDNSYFLGNIFHVDEEGMVYGSSYPKNKPKKDLRLYVETFKKNNIYAGNIPVTSLDINNSKLVGLPPTSESKLYRFSRLWGHYHAIIGKKEKKDYNFYSVKLNEDMEVESKVKINSGKPSILTYVKPSLLSRTSPDMSILVTASRVYHNKKGPWGYKVQKWENSYDNLAGEYPLEINKEFHIRSLIVNNAGELFVNLVIYEEDEDPYFSLARLTPEGPEFIDIQLDNNVKVSSPFLTILENTDDIILRGFYQERKNPSNSGLYCARIAGKTGEVIYDVSSPFDTNKLNKKEIGLDPTKKFDFNRLRFMGRITKFDQYVTGDESHLYTFAYSKSASKVSGTTLHHYRHMITFCTDLNTGEVIETHAIPLEINMGTEHRDASSVIGVYPIPAGDKMFAIYNDDARMSGKSLKLKCAEFENGRFIRSKDLASFRTYGVFFLPRLFLKVSDTEYVIAGKKGDKIRLGKITIK
ncbi:MAG: hypothetical protein AAF502_14510 [Bacteroidota bacterium]